MLARIYKTNLNLLEVLPRSCTGTFVMEGIILKKSTHLQLGCTLPFVNAMKLVKSDGNFITFGNLETSNLLELLPRSCPDTFVIVEDAVLMKPAHLELGYTLPLVNQSR